MGTMHPGDARPLRALARASREVAAEPDCVQSLWKLVCALREDLPLDRVGIFHYDRGAQLLERAAGIDQTGKPEYAGQCFPVDDAHTPLLQVARQEIPYYLSDDAPRDYPDVSFATGVRAHSIVPILAGGELLGALCVDNSLSQRPISQELIEPLFLYAALAALPLFALHQQQERERAEAGRWHIYREVLSAVTSGKILLCSQPEIDDEWPLTAARIPIERELDVRSVREAVRRVATEAGMEEERAMDLGLCASESATNALLHGRGGYALVEAQEGVLRVRITDHGEGIAPEDLPRATLLKGWSKRASMGLGFTVINETADRVYLHTGPQGTTVIIEMAVEPGTNIPDEANPLLWGEDLSLLSADLNSGDLDDPNL